MANRHTMTGKLSVAQLVGGIHTKHRHNPFLFAGGPYTWRQVWYVYSV
jgi:hypothetical protein